MKLAPMPWILCGPAVPAVQQRGVLGFDPDDLHAGLAGLEDSPDTGNSAAGADAGHEDVDLAVGVGPDFLGGGLLVDRRVGGVAELIGGDRVVGLGDDLLGLGHRAGHTLGARGEDDLGADRRAASPVVRWTSSPAS